MNARRLWSIVRKEFYQIIRDPSSLIISFFLPLLLLFIYGYGVSLDSSNIHIGLAALENSKEANEIVNALNHSPYFTVENNKEKYSLIDGMRRDAYRGVVTIGPNFAENLRKRGNPASIQILTDGSQVNTAQFVKGYVEGVYRNNELQTANEKRLPIRPGVSIQARFWYNPELKSHNYLIPGSIAITMTLIGTLLTALVVAREWERGTMEAMMATPMSVSEFLLGKFIPYFLLGIGAMIVCTLLAHFLFQMPFRGSYLILFAFVSAFLLCMLSIGLLISTVARNQFLAYQMAVMTGFLPAFMLSGFIFEIRNMPLAIQALTYLLPARYFVTAIQTLFLVGNVPKLLWTNFLFLIAFGSLMMLFLIKKTKKRLD